MKQFSWHTAEAVVTTGCYLKQWNQFHFFLSTSVFSARVLHIGRAQTELEVVTWLLDGWAWSSTCGNIDHMCRVEVENLGYSNCGDCTSKLYSSEAEFCQSVVFWLVLLNVKVLSTNVASWHKRYTSQERDVCAWIYHCTLSLFLLETSILKALVSDV